MLVVAYLLRLLPAQSRWALVIVPASGTALLAASKTVYWYLPLLAPFLVLAVWRANLLLRFAAGALIVAGFLFFKSGILMGQENWWSNPTMSWLPLGYSFVMFSSLALLIEGGPRHKIAYSLMPFSLVSGPFLQAPQMGPTLSGQKPPVLDGAMLLINGFFKKVLADNIQLHVIPLLGDSLVDSWLRLLLMGARFYCDFSGYTDMARGYARIAGYDLPVNFRLPFLSWTIQEFWARWHVSLGEWFRRYFFNPLSAKLWLKTQGRLSPAFVNRLVLILTVMLIAFWHGMSMQFWLWGLLTALFLMVPWPSKIWMWPFTLYIVFWTQALILSPSISQWWHHIGLAHGLKTGMASSISWEMGVFTVAVLVLPHFFDSFSEKQGTKMILVRSLIAAAQILLLIPFAGVGVPFVYSRF